VKQNLIRPARLAEGMQMFGVIQIYFPLRGFGYIHVAEDFRKRIFFHVTNWRAAEMPVRGQRVEFDLASGHKPGQRPQAVKIILATEGAR
jgi:cold shock CspA family protein